MGRDESIEEARRRFPAGLVQPEGGFRFSADALLLAGFAAELSSGPAAFADLGTGCGAAALALLLQKDGWLGAGLELFSVLADAAAANARMLGLEDRFDVVKGDVEDAGSLRRLRVVLSAMRGIEGESPMFDAVLCNPPWRKAGSGRLPPSELRRRALFGDGETFARFFGAADALLRQGGAFFAVGGADRTADMLAALPERMHPEVLRFIFTRKDAPAEFVLMKAVKNGRCGLKVESRFV